MTQHSTLRQGGLRGNKILYPDGIGCCVWYPMLPLDEKDAEAEECGICFDFSDDDIDDFILLLQALKNAPAEVFVDDDPEVD